MGKIIKDGQTIDDVRMYSIVVCNAENRNEFENGRQR